MQHHIGIIGAGIGGLAAAAGLAQAGHDVHLIERFDQPRPLGSGLVVQPVGLAVLDGLGVGNAARALGAEITHMLGHSGRRIALDVCYRPAAPGLAMHRAALFHVLWQAVQQANVPVITGIDVTHTAQHGAKRLICGGRGEQLGPFDLVIDASGAGSRLSPLRARALPFGAVWGQVAWPADTTLPANRLSQRYDAGRRMAGVLPMGRLPGDPTPRAAVFWSLPRSALDHWPGQDMNQWRAEVAALWPEMAPFLTTLTHAAHLTPARYSHGSLRKPYAPGLVFIGDAAHRASPQLGQGANMALLDAQALFHALTAPLDDALPAYAAMRRWHMRSYQAMSAVFTPMYQSDLTLPPMLRDHLLAPISRIWPLPRLLSSLVTGDLLPPLAGQHWPVNSGRSTLALGRPTG